MEQGFDRDHDPYESVSLLVIMMCIYYRNGKSVKTFRSTDTTTYIYFPYMTKERYLQL